MFLVKIESVSAIGIISHPISIENSLSGEVAEDTLIILNPSMDNVSLNLTATGKIASWIKFYKNKETIAPIDKLDIAGRNKADISVKFIIPKETKKGEYTGNIRLIQINKTTSSKIEQAIKINVSDNEVIGFKTSVMPKEKEFKTDRPLEIRIIYNNTGNSSIAPQILLKLYSSSNEQVYQANYAFPENEPIITPGSIREIPSIKVPIDSFDNDKYSGELFFAYKDFSQTQKFDFKIDSRLKNNNKIVGQITITLTLIAVLGTVYNLINKKKVKSRL